MKLIKGAVVLALGLSLLAGSAKAAVVIDITQKGNDVVVTATGEIDLYSLFKLGSITLLEDGVLRSGFGYVFAGVGGTYDAYGNVAGPSSFGTDTDLVYGSSGAGGLVGVLGNQGLIILPHGYVSGTPISSTSTFDDTTLKDFGLKPGKYVYSWPYYATPVDYMTVVVAPEPSTWAMLAVGFVGLGLAGREARADRRGDAQRPDAGGLTRPARGMAVRAASAVRELHRRRQGAEPPRLAGAFLVGSAPAARGESRSGRFQVSLEKPTISCHTA